MIALAPAIALAAAVAASPPPSYLVERIVTNDGEVRRVSVFRDGVAVLARRHGGEQPVVVKARLDDVAFSVLRQVVAETYPDLQTFAGFEGGAGDAVVELRLAPPERPPLIVRVPVSAVQSAAMVRLQRALDDVDEKLARTRADQQDLTHWQPERGQRVELRNGTVVEIIEVFSGGAAPVAQVRVGEGPGHVFYTVDELRRLAVRVLDR